MTLVNTVPSALAELLRLNAVPPSVRTVNLAGEPLRGTLAERVHAAAGVERLWNLYGPTEDTTYSTFALVAAGAGAPPIGRPLAGTQGLRARPRAAARARSACRASCTSAAPGWRAATSAARS